MVGVLVRVILVLVVFMSGGGRGAYCESDAGCLGRKEEARALTAFVSYPRNHLRLDFTQPNPPFKI